MKEMMNFEEMEEFSMKQTLMNLQEKTRVFMQGRYGVDQFNRVQLILWLVLLAASVVSSTFEEAFWVTLGLRAAALLVAAWVLFRVLSKNISKRSAENYKYLAAKGKVQEYFNLQKLRRKERKTHVYKKCPHCKKVVRLARKNGRHTVRCPLCTNTFKVKIRGGTK